MVMYSEYEYEIWCRRRAAALGDSDDGGLYWKVRRQDRPIFEETVRERDRLNRQPSELTGLAEIMSSIGGGW